MEREGEENQDKDGWTHSRGIRAVPPSATRDETPEIERDGEELPRLSPGVGCDSAAQCNKVMIIYSLVVKGLGGAVTERV